MVESYRSKALKRLHEQGDRSGVDPKHVAKLRLILGLLNVAEKPSDVNFPGSGLHRLKGPLEGYHAVSVSGNWRVIFRIEDGDAYDVDYDDYH